MTGDALTRERVARLALARTREPGDLWLARAVAEAGAVELFDHLRSGRRRSGTAATIAARLSEGAPERDLARGERLGLRFVVPGDEEWPDQVDDLSHAEDENGTGGAPLGLWARGPLRLDALTRSVAIVGSRSATTYGADVAAQIGAECAAEGWTVVSGGAVGIDIAAHRGALAAGGRTVAVLACGADRVYPLSHEQLIEHIAAEGLVVSETLPGGAPLKGRFLTRNRLIAGLTRGTVVVEAARRSGALNSATWTTRINRPLMGVPGPVTSATSEGVHELVRSGRASLVTSGGDVLEMVGEMGEHTVSARRGPERPHDRLTATQRQVLEAVPAQAPAVAGSIARTAGLGLNGTLETLHELLASGLVTTAGHGWVLARQPEEAFLAT
jgi:DNA processing protein